MKIGIIIQARTGSTRLQNKVLLPFRDQDSVLGVVIDRLKETNLPIVVATSTLSQDDRVQDIAINKGVDVFRGEEDNVLKRFVDAATLFSFTDVIRVCADNPLINKESILLLLEAYQQRGGVDYLSYQTEDGLPVIKSHLGLFSEIVAVKALKRVLITTQESLYLEHVTNYLYEHEGDFCVIYQDLPEVLLNQDDLRFTMDTLIDYKMLKEMYSILGEQKCQDFGC